MAPPAPQPAPFTAQPRPGASEFGSLTQRLTAGGPEADYRDQELRYASSTPMAEGQGQVNREWSSHHEQQLDPRGDREWISHHSSAAQERVVTPVGVAMTGRPWAHHG